MSNSPTALLRDALDARRAVSQAIRVHVIPPSPVDWARFDAATVLDGASADLCLAALTRFACGAPARTAELRALWSECVATGAHALRLAPLVGADAGVSGVAGLLHRLGDLLALHAIAGIESDLGLRLEAAHRAELCAEHGPAMLDAALRQWQVPARAAAMAAGWQRLRDFPGAAAEAAVVYLARLLSIEALRPEFCVPGIIEHAALELGVDAALFAAVRGDAAVTAMLESQGLRPQTQTPPFGGVRA